MGQAERFQRKHSSFIKETLIQWFGHFSKGERDLLIQCKAANDPKNKLTAVTYQLMYQFAEDCGFEVHTTPQNRARGVYLLRRPDSEPQPHKGDWRAAQAAQDRRKTLPADGPCYACTSRNRCKKQQIACGEFYEFVACGPVGEVAQAAWDVPCKTLYETIYDENAED